MQKLHDVLIVDDSDPDLLYTAIVLEQADIAHRVLPFGTALEALQFLQRPEGHDADVILLDINMPEMSGFEFLDAYQRLHESQLARAVVVMLTSSPNPADRNRALSYHCVKAYVVKPIDLHSARQLLDVVAQLDKRAG